MKKIQNRKTPVDCWYFDVSLIASYWSQQVARSYHHTAPVSLNISLRESLLMLSEEGLENVWERHRRNAELFWEGLEKMGLRLHVEKSQRLPTLSTICIPEGVDGKAVTSYLLQKHNIEIGNGLGSLAGKVWRFLSFFLFFFYYYLIFFTLNFFFYFFLQSFFLFNRIGLMGCNSTKESIEMLLDRFREALTENGFKCNSNL